MAMPDVMGIILGGGRGTRLYPLTKLRAKPAVPIGGKYRLIDVPISNCLNSGVTKIYVLTQFLSASLHRHIFQTYKFDLFSGGFVDILAAEETPSGMDWYQGTADAVRKQVPRLIHARVEDAMILSGDHLYRMDYSNFVEWHREKRADLTIAVQPVGPEAATRFGIMKINDDTQVTTFSEKPGPDELVGLESDADSDKPYLGSMGIYIFRSDVLFDILRESDAEDFGNEVIPACIEKKRVYAYPFEGYWADIGTIKSFYDANLAITAADPPFEFYEPKNPIYSRPRFLPPASVQGNCKIEHSAVVEGTLLDRVDITHSVIGLRSVIGPDVTVKRTVMLGADFYENPERKAENRSLGRPDVGIGEGSSIEGAIIDKNARIGAGVTIRPHSPEEGMIEKENYVIRDGIVVIPKNSIIPDGTTI